MIACRTCAHKITDAYTYARTHILSSVLCAILVAALVLGGTVFAYADSGDGSALRGGAGSLGAGGASRIAGEELIKELTSAPMKGAEYDGYLVKISEGALGKVDSLAMNRVAEDVVGGEVAWVDKPEDALRFADAGDIEIIEPNYIFKAFALPQTDPVDLYYPDQWGIKYVNAKAAWQAGYRGDGVNVAILDSGIVKGHEDLGRDKIIEEWNWIGRNGNAADDNMHGSVVGGIIAADTDNPELGTSNGIGMAGIADKSNLIIHKILDSRGSGSEIVIINALNDILEDGNGVDVVNMSLGMEGKGQYFQIMDGYIQKIINKGTIMVAATGNNGADDGGSANAMNYPAGCANVIGVGSIGRNGTVSYFSTKNSSVDVVAPGEESVSLKYSDPSGYYIHTYVSGGKTYGLDGTSFSSPIVAAAAAIAKQRDRNIDTGAFLTALKRTSRDAGPKGYDKSYGYGILDMGKLTTYLKTAALTASFNANGGKVGTASKTVWPGGKYGYLPIPTKSGAVFSGWYTSRSGGQRITSSSIVGSSGITLYAHWQPGNTLTGLAASKGTLSPVFSYKKTSYKLTLSNKVGQTKIAPAKPSGATIKIKVGSGKYKPKSSVTVKLKKGAKTKVYVKVSKKGMKTKLYKISVQRKK